ncbi:MAG: hypothetical protein ACRCYO_13525 [Bacteroidia bacterium]
MSETFTINRKKMRACRVDANQTKIVEAWRKSGASVKLVHTIKGFCDAIVGYNGVVYIAEIKDGDKDLTSMEKEYKAEIEAVGCKYNIIRNVKQALNMIGVNVTESPIIVNLVGCQKPCLKQPDGSDTLFKTNAFYSSSSLYSKQIECKQCKKTFMV